MRIWYVGAVTMSLPMLGNGVLISAGDSHAASWFMIVGTVLNTLLNPILIFGYFGCPAMGIGGSALATVLAQGVSTIWLLRLLRRKHRLLIWRAWGLGDYLASLRRITRFAVPSVLSLILMPISAGVITKILSAFGNEAVAASGTAGRIESFAFMIPMALGISLTPFVSQNFGAKRMDRVREAQRVATRFALGYGGLMAVAFFVSAPWMAAVFTDDPKVAEVLVSYTRIICFGYGMMEVHRYCGFFLTGMHKPISATVLNVIRVVALLIPLSCLGARFWGVNGVFAGRLATDIVVGCIGLLWVARALRTHVPDGGGNSDGAIA
jgi:putative MATE family efflux protein